MNGISSLSDINFSIGDITSALSELKPDSSAGPDGWPAFLLHQFRDIFAPHLHKIWRKSLDTGNMPELINLAYITPLFKGGEKCDPAEYRPIALTSHITKVFERVVRKAIIQHLASNHLLNPTQHGFMSQRSTLTQLIQYYTDILNLLDKHGSVDAVYLDFAKAFDKCDHGVILHKLKQFGISGKLGIWLHSFLTNRQQAVCVMGEISSKTWVTSGVPQGSVLGPLLFSILISDINSGVSISSLLSYADDTKIYVGISESLDESTLQADLSQIYEWAEANNQEFNTKKFEAIRFSLESDHGSYLNSKSLPIENKSLIKDLGIYFSDDCAFNEHIDIIIAKNKKLCGWSLRSFDARDKDTMLTLLKFLILPTIEYCCPLWSPTDQPNIQKLERIQRSFTKKIDNFFKVPYRNRLEFLKIYSLERRRERYIIIYTWKALFGHYPDPGINYCRTDRNNGIILTVPTTKKTKTFKKLFNRQFLCQGTILFNLLPSHLRQLITAEGSPMTPLAYKGKLDKFLSEIPDEPYDRKRPRQNGATTNSIKDQLSALPKEKRYKLYSNKNTN